MYIVKSPKVLYFLFPVFFEPTDMRRAHIPFELPRTLTQQIKFISPNIYELKAIAKALHCEQDFWSDSNFEDVDHRHQLLADLHRIGGFVGNHIENVIVTLGALGVLIVRRHGVQKCFYSGTAPATYVDSVTKANHQARFYAAQKIGKIVNVSGAGDSFNSGFIAAMIRGHTEPTCVSVGFEAAKSALQSQGAVPKTYFDFEHSCWSKTAHYMDIE